MNTTAQAHTQYKENLIDDTEMKLTLAENSYNNGKLDEATALYKRILASRISMYEVQFHLKPKKYY